MAEGRKILILGDINSIHLQKWILGLMNDFEIAVFSLDPLDSNSAFLEKISKGVKLVTNAQMTTSNNNKSSYLKSFSKVKKLFQEFKPDIVHAHYATSYGLLGALLRFDKLIISVWGTDVYSFPKKSFLHKIGFKFILKRAHTILSTSENMAKEIANYSNKTITVIPFGIDCELFKPIENKQSNPNFVIGTVKSLEKVYGIDRLLLSFSLFHEKYPQSECVIYGSGSQLNELTKLAEELQIINSVHFMGTVTNNNVPEVLNQMDVFCAFSRQESFGVAVVEASACGLPVIVTDVGGLPEVVENEKTGYIVQGKPEEIYEKMELLYNNSLLRKEMGEQGRQLVLQKYEWMINLEQMKTIYGNLVK